MAVRTSNSGSQSLQQLQSAKFELAQQINSLSAKQADLARQIDRLQQRYTETQRLLEAMKQPLKDIEITDHAMLRFLERVLGEDLAALQRAILPTEVKQTILRLGNGDYPVTYGTRQFIVRARDGVIVTVIVKRHGDMAS